MQNLLSSEKWTLDHWATIELFFSLAQVRCFWRCFYLRSGLEAIFLKMSERGDSWCTHSSFSSLLWSSPKSLNWLCLIVFSSLQVIPVACAQFLPSICPICFDTALLEQPPSFSNGPLWLTLFVEGVNDRLMDHCQVSSVLHYCGFKEQEITQSIPYGWSFIETSNVNIPIFWDTDFWLSLAVSSNYPNKKSSDLLYM